MRHRLTPVLALLALAACGDSKTDHDSAAVRDSAANATATANGTLAGDEIDIEELDVGTALKPDSTLDKKGDDFKAGDTIYAVMETDANESGKQVTARWTMGDNDQVVNEETRTVATGDKARTVFKGKAGGWAPGKYHFRVLYNGKEVKNKEFEVK